MAKKQTGKDDARNAFENGIRTKLDNPRPRDPSSLSPVLLELVDGCRAAIPKLEVQYFRTRNPVHVWDAIIQAWSVAQTLKQPLELPTWVQAYLVQSAIEVMGDAVARKVGNLKKPQRKAAKNERVTHQYSSAFDGLSDEAGEERTELFLQALRIKTGTTSNPLSLAHTRMRITEKIQAVEWLKKEKGLTLREALDVYGFVEYQGKNGERLYYKHRNLATGKTTPEV